MQYRPRISIYYINKNKYLLYHLFHNVYKCRNSWIMPGHKKIKWEIKRNERIQNSLLSLYINVLGNFKRKFHCAFSLNLHCENIALATIRRRDWRKQECVTKAGLRDASSILTLLSDQASLLGCKFDLWLAVWLMPFSIFSDPSPSFWFYLWT